MIGPGGFMAGPKAEPTCLHGNDNPPSYCLKHGWGACRMCAAGFPQNCQCKPKSRKKKKEQSP